MIHISTEDSQRGVSSTNLSSRSALTVSEGRGGEKESILVPNHTVTNIIIGRRKRPHSRLVNIIRDVVVSSGLSTSSNPLTMTHVASLGTHIHICDDSVLHLISIFNVDTSSEDVVQNVAADTGPVGAVNDHTPLFGVDDCVSLEQTCRAIVSVVKVQAILSKISSLATFFDLGVSDTAITIAARVQSMISFEIISRNHNVTRHVHDLSLDTNIFSSKLGKFERPVYCNALAVNALDESGLRSSFITVLIVERGIRNDDFITNVPIRDVMLDIDSVLAFANSASEQSPSVLFSYTVDFDLSSLSMRILVLA
jgi:hypothetical protein